MNRCYTRSASRRVRIRCTGGDMTTTESLAELNLWKSTTMAGSNNSGTSRSIDTRPQPTDSNTLLSTSAATSKSERSKPVISSLSAVCKNRRPMMMLATSSLLALQLQLLLLLLSSSSSSTATATSTATASKSAALNELQQKTASYTPLAGNPKHIHSSSSINTEQLQAARSPLSMAVVGRLSPPTVDGTAKKHESSFLLVSPLDSWQGDVIRRIGRAINEPPHREGTRDGAAAKLGTGFIATEEPTCRQLTTVWRAFKQHYPTLADYLIANLPSVNVKPHLPRFNIGNILTQLDKSLNTLNSHSMQKMRPTNSPFINRLYSNPFYYNIYRRYMDNLNVPVVLPEYLNRLDTTDYTTEATAEKEVIYGRPIKHPNEWNNNHIATTNEKLHYLKMLSKQFETDPDEQQQHPSETQPEDVGLPTSMPMYGRVILNPSEIGPDSPLNRRRITTENLEKLRKLARSDIGYD